MPLDMFASYMPGAPNMTRQVFKCALMDFTSSSRCARHRHPLLPHTERIDKPASNPVPLTPICHPQPSRMCRSLSTAAGGGGGTRGGGAARTSIVIGGGFIGLSCAIHLQVPLPLPLQSPPPPPSPNHVISTLPLFHPIPSLHLPTSPERLTAFPLSSPCPLYLLCIAPLSFHFFPLSLSLSLSLSLPLTPFLLSSKPTPPP